jgi:hypothetical protein
MHRDRIAEWILAQVTSRERAASTVGDLVETAATRGPAWFWSSVLGTAASLLWRGIATDPRGMLGLAFCGWAVSVGLLVGCMVCLALVVQLLAAACTALSHSGYVRLGAESWRLIVRLNSAAAVWGVLTLCQFQVGRWIARRVPRRELSACMALLLLQFVLWVFGVGVTIATGQSGRLPILGRGIQSLGLSLPCVLGSLWVRRRATL